MHEAKIHNQPTVEVWGSGTPMREFLHADDLAAACYFLMEHYNEPGLVNIGTGEDVSIRELAELIQKIVGYKGKIQWDAAKPDGTPRKLLDVSKLNALGWKYTTGLETGIRSLYESESVFQAVNP